MHWVFVAVWGLSLVAVSRGISLVAAHGLLIVVASFGVEHSLQVHGPQYLCCMGLVDLQHVGSSCTRDWTHVPWIGRQILYHWTTREVPCWLFKCTICGDLFLLFWLVTFVFIILHSFYYMEKGSCKCINFSSHRSCICLCHCDL